MVLAYATPEQAGSVAAMRLRLGPTVCITLFNVSLQRRWLAVNQSPWRGLFSEHPVNRRPADIQRLGDQRHRLAAGPHPLGQGDLVGAQRARPADERSRAMRDGFAHRPPPNSWVIACLRSGAASSPVVLAYALACSTCGIERRGDGGVRHAMSQDVVRNGLRGQAVRLVAARVPQHRLFLKRG